MRCALRLSGVEGYAYGTIKRPENAQDAEKWDHDDLFAQLVISNNIPDSEMTHVARCETANAMWEGLEAEHDPESIMHRFSIPAVGRSLFQTTVEDGADFGKHFLKLSVYWERFNAIAGDDAKISDALFKIIIADSLPPSWDTFTEPYLGLGVSDEADGTDPRKRMESHKFISAIVREEYLIREARSLRAESQAAASRCRLANRMAAATNAGSGMYRKRRGRRHRNT
ncbi:hypothetical protein EDB85DRAFT_2155894 [Lactarius pseudohatsudake]|nr:hypothetical protein EDB85DRAFT_2155894 [Lactarius pseudohatsudake]